MREDINELLSQVLGVRRAALSDDASVDTVEASDSLRQIRLIMALEEEFHVTFDDDEIGELISILAISRSLGRHKDHAVQ